MKLSSLATIGALMLLTACMPPSPRVVKTPVRVGMDKADLLAAYGPPTWSEHGKDGVEDWYYYFGESPRPHPPGAKRTISTTQPVPIHLSPVGKVVSPVPAGHVIRQ